MRVCVRACVRDAVTNTQPFMYFCGYAFLEGANKCLLTITASWCVVLLYWCVVVLLCCCVVVLVCCIGVSRSRCIDV